MVRHVRRANCALLDDADEERIEELVDFYDYLEIQPIGNNEFMFDKEKGAYANINTWDDLKEMNRRIVRLGEKYNKPVCATCDVHFLDPEDDIYRTILSEKRGMMETGRHFILEQLRRCSRNFPT